jgi:periplasmic mercuric ion binding protein
MRNILKSLVILVVFQFSLAMAFTASAQDKNKEKEEKETTMKCWVSMTCAGCQAKIEKNIAFEKGVTGLETDLTTKTVTIKYNTKKTDPGKLEKAIQKLGYKTEILEK